MQEELKSETNFKFQPVTKNRWEDFEKLFGDKGAYAGCWCMYWREKNSIFKKNQGSRNKRAIKKLIFDKKVPGLLAYDDKNPV